MSVNILTWLGDCNLDGAVDFSDLLALAQSYGASSGGDWSTGDANYDGAVDFADLLLLAQNYGATAVQGDVSDATAGVIASDWALAQSLVLEPVTGIFAIVLGMTGKRRRSA